MTSGDRNDLVPAPQEKQEWVTPKISLMGAENTEVKYNFTGTETKARSGPS